MPGKIIKLFDTQADWQSGTISNMDSTTKPGSMIASVTAGPEVYWISPFIDISKSKSDRLTIGVETDMDIKRSIRPSNYIFSRPSVALLSNGTRVAANVPRFEQGKFGKAIMVEEGTTSNIAHDPNTDNAWWNAAPTSGIAWGLSNDWSATEQALKVRSYSSLYHGHSFYLDIQRDVYFTLGAKIKNVKNALHNQFYLALYNSAGTCIRTNYVPEILAQYNWTNHNTPDYTEAWITYRIPSGVYTDAVKYTVQLLGSGTSISEIYLKDIQLEQNPYKTPWRPYNSTHSPETLTIPTEGVLNPQEGTVECYAYINDASRYQNRYSTIFMADAGGSGRGLWLLHLNSTPYWRYQIKNEDNQSKYIDIPDADVPNGWHHFAITWNSAEAKLFIDGELKGTMTTPPLPSAIQRIDVGCWETGNQFNSLIDDLRISSIARSDEEILAAYQSNEPLPADEYTTYYEPFDGLNDWQVVGVVFENPHTVSLQVKIEPSKTKVGDQYIDSLGLWDTITLPMLERPDIEIAPPECNKITVYTDTTEKSATVPGTSSDRIVEIRVEAPEGSSEAYCQQMADAILAAKSKERLSITCKVPLVTSLRFGELVPVILPYIGATIDKPYMAHVQRMEHHILDNPPYTILSLGDFLPDDIEALVRLLKEG